MSLPVRAVALHFRVAQGVSSGRIGEQLGTSLAERGSLFKVGSIGTALSNLREYAVAAYERAGGKRAEAVAVERVFYLEQRVVVVAVA